MITLKEGEKAPGFALPDEAGKIHKLADYRGRWVLLYFYPKDNTPGCTQEACEIRDNILSFGTKNTVVLGVSADSQKSHTKFKKKYDLPFPLLADESKEVIQKYGVWDKKKFLGRKYIGILRASFLIDPKGNIAKIYHQVKPKLHATEVLADRIIEQIT